MSIKIPEYVDKNYPKSKIQVCWRPGKSCLLCMSSMSKLTKVSSSGVTGCLRRRGLLCRGQSLLLWMQFIRNLQGLRHNFKQRKWNVQEQNADCQTTVPSPEEEPNYFVQLPSLQAPSSNYKLKIPLTNNPCANYILRDSKRRNATWLRHP